MCFGARTRLTDSPLGQLDRDWKLKEEKDKMDALQAELDEGKPKDEASQSEAPRFSRRASTRVPCSTQRFRMTPRPLPTSAPAPNLPTNPHLRCSLPAT